MHAADGLLVYTVGVDPLLAQALAADLPAAVLRRRRSLVHAAQCRGRCPDIVVVDISGASIDTELDAVRSTWGDRVVVVGVDRRRPFAWVWRRPDRGRIVELGPGFLEPYLAEQPM